MSLVRLMFSRPRGPKNALSLECLQLIYMPEVRELIGTVYTINVVYIYINSCVYIIGKIYGSHMFIHTCKLYIYKVI